jgi:mannose-1-phosphate guanylyltransferase
MYCVIMAGGRGTRFWPASRKNNPKQLLNIVGKTTMLQMTVDRFQKMKNIEDIFIVTSKDLAPKIKKMINGIKSENIIIEPSGKNTAPAIGLAALRIKSIRKDAVMGVFPADHLVIGAQKFAKTVRSAIQISNKSNGLVTIGIEPKFASTGYGYIQFDPDSALDYLAGFKVKTFAEKPHKKLAERFVSSGDFLWNGGMFIWKVSTFFNELETHMEEFNSQLKKIEKKIDSNQDFNHIWKKIQPESIDYGLMEKSDNIYVVKSEFEWNDLGSWDAIFGVSPKTKDKNVIRGNGLVMDGKNNLIESNNHFTAVVGVDNIVVVNTPDATLVIPRDKVENIKELVAYLEKNKKSELL